MGQKTIYIFFGFHVSGVRMFECVKERFGVYWDEMASHIQKKKKKDKVTKRVRENGNIHKDFSSSFVEIKK